MKKQTKLVEVLASNLERLMEDHPTLNTNKAVGEKAHVGRSTVQRIRAMDGTTTLEKVEAIAAVFDKSAADLLSESGHASSNEDRPVSVDEIVEVISIFGRISAETRNEILGFAKTAEEQERLRNLGAGGPAEDKPQGGPA